MKLLYLFVFYVFRVELNHGSAHWLRKRSGNARSIPSPIQWSVSKMGELALL